MLLREAEQLIAERGEMTLADLAIHFHSDPAAIEAMLERLVRKGRLVRDGGPPAGGCGGCVQCGPEERPRMVVYRPGGETTPS